MTKSQDPETKPKRNELREERISMQIIVDCYDESEQAMGWYGYLKDKLNFPFMTRYIKERAISPLSLGAEREVVGIAPEDECHREMFVAIRWQQTRTLAVPLAQLAVIDGDEPTRQAVEDWHYWVGMGYKL
jgi:hypothetical protein